jgi:putative sporulation protein YtaF
MQNLHLVTILLLSLSSNLDNVGVGASYGVRKINIPFASNLLIALVTSGGTLLSILLGQGIYLFISDKMAGCLGGGIIIAAGIWVLFQQKIVHRGKERPQARQRAGQTGRPGFGFRQIVAVLNNPIIGDGDFSGHVGLREAAALALGLTINNIPNGIGAGMLGCGAVLMTGSVFLLSIMTVWIGITGGHLGFKWLGRSAGAISGLILIAVGLCEIVF